VAARGLFLSFAGRISSCFSPVNRASPKIRSRLGVDSSAAGRCFGTVHYACLALADPREINTDGSGSDTVVSTAAGEIGHPRGLHHRLVGVQPSLMQVPPTWDALYERRPPAGLSKKPSQRHSCLSSRR
jgi:hypothetical protein